MPTRAAWCIAFDLVVGGPPFSGTPNDVIRAHITQPPEVPSMVRPSLGIPTELDLVILRCLEKKPEDRFQSAAEVFAALQKVPGYPPPKSPPRRRFVPLEKTPTKLSTRAASEPDAYGNLRGALRDVLVIRNAQ